MKIINHTASILTQVSPSLKPILLITTLYCVHEEGCGWRSLGCYRDLEIAYLIGGISEMTHLG